MMAAAAAERGVTSLIITCAPEAACAKKTLNSLRFGQTAATVVIAAEKPLRKLSRRELLRIIAQLKALVRHWRDLYFGKD